MSRSAQIKELEEELDSVRAEIDALFRLRRRPRDGEVVSSSTERELRGRLEELEKQEMLLRHRLWELQLGG